MVMMAVLVYLCWRASGSVLLASALGIFSVFGLWQVLIIRPQTFSLLLFVVLYGVLVAAERRPWLLLVPPGLLALWANLHGGFPIGLALIGCFVLAAAWQAWWSRGRQAWRDGRAWAYSLCLAACTLATFANPYSWQVYQYVALTSSRASGRNIDEWLPPGLNLFISKMWMISVLAVLLLFALPARRPRARDVCLVFVFLPFACGSVRMVAWWLIVSAPIIAELLGANLRHLSISIETVEKPARTAWAFLGVLMLAMLLSVPWPDRFNPLIRALAGAAGWYDEGYQPAAPARGAHRVEDDLETVAQDLAGKGRRVEDGGWRMEDGGCNSMLHPPSSILYSQLRTQTPERPEKGRIFTRFEWGEYLSWSLGPRYTVFMDGRIEIYPDDVLEAILGLDQWASRLAEHSRQVSGGLSAARRRLSPRPAAPGGTVARLETCRPVG